MSSSRSMGAIPYARFHFCLEIPMLIPYPPFVRPVFIFLLGLAVSTASHAGDSISGAGSSAAYPVYKTWAEQYARSNGTTLNYDPAGSSAGLKKIRARESDFGASDVAPSAEELARDDLVVFPTAITGAVPVYNLPKIRSGQLVLNGEVLAEIFSGKVTHWNDPRLQRLNPGLALPASAIVPIVRADGSGTTFHFSDYLARVSTDWKQQMGVGTTVKWPQGFSAVKGSKGVAQAVAGTPGSIGYVDYNYVVEHQLSAAQMRLADGSLVEAGPNAFRKALMQSSWLGKGDFTQTLTNIPGKGNWPITMGTFVVLPRIANNPERASAVIRFFTWAFIYGDELANRVNFVRLPDTIQAKAYRALAGIRDANGLPIGVGELSVKIAAAR